MKALILLLFTCSLYPMDIPKIKHTTRRPRFIWGSDDGAAYIAAFRATLAKQTPEDAILEKEKDKFDEELEKAKVFFNTSMEVIPEIEATKAEIAKQVRARDTLYSS